MQCRFVALVAGLLTATSVVHAATAGGTVYGPSPVPGGTVFGTYNCQYANAGAFSAGGACGNNATAPNAFGVIGNSSSFVDANGLHAFTTQEIFLIGQLADDEAHGGMGYDIVARSEADASLRDTLRFAATAPNVGIARLTYRSDGSTAGGGSVQSSLYLTDLASGGALGCTNASAGACTVDQLVHFHSGLQIDADVSVFAAAGVGRDYGTSSVSTSDFGNTSFVSSIQFFDVNGTPLALSFSADSGYAYPMAAAVPEPAGWTLMLVGLAACGRRLDRRRR